MSNKPQPPAIEQTQPGIDISAEVAKHLKASQDTDRAESLQDLQAAGWLAVIEACNAITNALTPKPEFRLAAPPADDDETQSVMDDLKLRKALLLIPASKRATIKTMADVHAFHATKGGK